MPSTKEDYCTHPDCLRKGTPQRIKGRGLCRACYNKAQRQGWLRDWRQPVAASPAVNDVSELPSEPAMVQEAPPSPMIALTIPTSTDSSIHRPTDSPIPTPKRSTPVEKIARQIKKTVKQLNQDFRVSVDFAAAAHVLEEIKVRAEREMRPVQNQIVWELKRALAAGEEAV